ncbi:MAG: Ig-like domain-containing protein [Oscillospiraceae bacterium]|nr:Ig-like domain-containing protein [Oscillospiraceae bacterium]
MKIKKIIAAVVTTAMMISVSAVTSMTAYAVDCTCGVESCNDDCSNECDGSDCSCGGGGAVTPTDKCDCGGTHTGTACTCGKEDCSCVPTQSACGCTKENCSTFVEETGTCGCSKDNKCSNSDCTTCKDTGNSGNQGSEDDENSCTCEANCEECVEKECATKGECTCEGNKGNEGEGDETEDTYTGYIVLVQTADAEDSNDRFPTIKVDETVELTAKVYGQADEEDSTGTLIENAVVSWTSNDEEIATVDENGVVTAVAEGKVEIWAHYPADTENKNSQYDMPAVVTVEAADKELPGGEDTTTPGGDEELPDGDDDNTTTPDDDDDTTTPPAADEGTTTPPATDEGTTTPPSDTGVSAGGGSSAPGAAPAGATIPSSNSSPATSSEAASTVKAAYRPSITITAPSGGITADVIDAFAANKTVKKITVKFDAVKIEISKDNVTGAAADLDFTKGENFLTSKDIKNNSTLKGSEKVVQLNFDKEGDFGGVSKVKLKSYVGRELRGKTAVVYEYKDGELVKVASGKIAATGNLSFNIKHYGQYVIAVD